MLRHNPLVQLAVLVNFAFTARLYDLLRREPTFFTVRQAGVADILGLVLVLSVLLPAVFVLVEVVARRFGEKSSRVVHTVLATLLLVFIALNGLRSINLLNGPILLIAGLSLGVAASFVYVHFEVAQRTVAMLWPAMLVFPGWMLFASPVRHVFSGGFDPPAIETRVTRPAPVVLIVFDEFCGMSLCDAEGQLDGRRFPNFTTLAKEATWFRNATTMSPSTHEAVPCLLTGQFPKDPSHPPEVFEYPDNLFRLLGRSHEPVVFETETRLCPPHLRNWPEVPTSFASRMQSMLVDLSVVELHLMLPPAWPWKLPDLTGRWANFLDRSESGCGHRGAFHRAEQFDEFIARIKPGERPGLYVAHVMLPHVPYDYLPSGQTYAFSLSERELQSLNLTHGIIGLQRGTERWIDDDWPVAQAAQRYLLQVEFVDRLMGRLVAHLKQVGMYDETMIVVTADHGVSFRAGDCRREATKTNYADILSIPLFIKAPHQHRGGASDRNVQSVDIVPTIADALRAEVPWHVDGISALNEQTAPPSRKEFTPEESWQNRVAYDSALPEKFAVCRHFDQLVGRRTDALDLYAIGPRNELVGRPIQEFQQGEVPNYEVAVLGASGSPVLSGQLLGDQAPAAVIDLAIAVNGRIAAVTRTYRFADFQNAWTAILAPEKSDWTVDDLAVYAIDANGNRLRLLPIRIVRK